MSNPTIIHSTTEPKPEKCPECWSAVSYREKFDSSGWVLMECDSCIDDEATKRTEKDKATRFEEFQSTIPPAYIDAKLRDLDDEFDALKTAYHHQSNELLFMTGAAGIGKTYALYALLQEAYQDDRPCSYVDFREFLFDVKLESAGGSYASKAYQVQALGANYRGILLIDDFGAESISKVTREAVDTILSSREKWRPGLTIVASNLSLDQIAPLFDDRISSRLSANVVTLIGKDRRVPERSGE